MPVCPLVVIALDEAILRRGVAMGDRGAVLSGGGDIDDTVGAGRDVVIARAGVCGSARKSVQGSA